ncbi:MAG: hypothetical protein AB7I18_00200 [Candidatus Berkiella sp.]
MRIVRYWQEGLWQTIYNQQPLPKALLEKAWQCQQQEIKTGQLVTVLPAEGAVPVWVAPLVFYKANPHPEYWVPLWLPASLEKQQLLLRHDKSLPWVPASQFDSCQNGPFQGERAAVDDWLRYECLNEDNELIWDNWPDCVKACMDALSIFSEHPWQETLSANGFQVISQSMIWPEATLFGAPSDEQTLSPLLKQFCELDEIDKLSLEEKGLGDLDLFCGSAKKELAHGTYQTISTLLALKDEPLLVLRTPIGSDKIGCLSTFIASKMVQHTLNTHRLPIIAFLTADTQNAALMLQSFIPSSEQVVTLEELKQAFVNYQQGLQYAKAAEDGQENEKLLAELQFQDESLEKMLQGYFIKQDELKPKSRLAQFLQKFHKDKQKAAQSLMLSEKIRKCKTKRTNIHRKIVKVVDSINDRRQYQVQWQTWLQQFLPDVATDIASVQLAFSHKLLMMTLAYWQQQNALRDWLVINPSCEQRFDYVLIDEAQMKMPQQVAPYLANATQALFLGNNQEYETSPAISQLAEERALAKHQLDDEETIEQMHYKGMLIGTGNALTVALANTRAPIMTLDAGLYHPQIAEYLGEKQYESSIVFSADEGMHFLNIAGCVEKIGPAQRNELEAHTIVHWILNGPFKAKQHLIQVVTPFAAQQQFIRQQLQLVGVHCPVYDFAHLPNQVGEIVVFSPVYTHLCRRPFIFDRGEHHFYRMIARARRAFWIVGDKRIFDAKMHSPSGQLAKRLFGLNGISNRAESVSA